MGRRLWGAEFHSAVSIVRIPLWRFLQLSSDSMARIALRANIAPAIDQAELPPSPRLRRTRELGAPYVLLEPLARCLVNASSSLRA